MSFELHDPVFVDRGDVRLEGVVLYKGSVDFASGDDWVGVRLTGESADKGKNDGSVQGRSYFACPPNGGIFVRASAVSKREITKLEELKLRRELGIGRAAAGVPGGGAGPAAAVAATPRRIPPATPSRPGASAPSASQPVPSTQPANAPTAGASSSGAPPTSTVSKLEELRQRRAALNARKQGEPTTTTTSSSAGGSAAAAGGDAVASPAPPRTPGAVALAGQSPLASSRGSSGVFSSSSVPSTPKSLSNVSSSASLKELQEAGLTVAAAKSSGAASAAAAASVSLLQQELDRATGLLAEKEADVTRLASDLEACRDQVRRLEEQVREARQHAADARAAVPRSPDAASSSSLARVQQQHQETIDSLQGQVIDLEHQLADAKESADAYQAKLRGAEREVKDREGLAEQLSQARAESLALKQEIQDIVSQNERRGVADASHYKERAKLQAEIAAHKRKAEQLEREKQDLEATVEDLTLDKEQLEQEKESLEDRVDELKLDAETARMEAEELKLELEDAQEAAERAATASESTERAAAAIGGDAEEVAQALSVQNARLREALIRLREQSTIEKMELTRQLRDAEKEAEAGRAVSGELDSLRALKLRLEEQINDLKDMVEQGSAFETMVEDLSDRVLSIEDENTGLRSTIRELEEAAELTAEMEELQADELKALNRDLEGRDTIIRNLEEAIKMQRRREDDFLRTVANYRTTVATLKQEKQALLDIQQGGEGEKFDLIATSQNALARAAQLVSDAAETRRREAKAALDGIERSLFKSLSERIDSLVPHSHVSAELSAITGELQASKALSVASKTLHGITSSFAKAIRPALPESEGTDNASASGSMHLSDELRQKVTNIFYQAEFAQVIADTASELIRLLVAGQWPGLLSQTESIELGSRLSHPASSIDATLGAVLKCLIEEGSLTPEQSNLEAVRRTLNSNVQSMHSDLRQDNDRELVSMNWKPPALDMMKEASFAKFSSLAMAAALSTVVSEGDQSRSSDVSRIYSKIEQLSSQAIAVCQRLSAVEVTDEALVAKLSALVLKWAEGSAQLASSVRDALLGNRDWKTCEELSETNLRDLALLSSTLRASKLSPSDEGVLHPFSPESDDGWSGITAIACRVRSLDGDGDDVNYLVRARVVERRLSNAVDNESKLETATSRIASLEKGLTSKMKEISILTARLSELEKLLAKSSTPGTPINRSLAMDFRSSDEFRALEDENRMLSEAMDVLNRQVEEYENEIRALKDFKSPSKGSRSRATPRRAVTSVADSVSSPYGRIATDEAESSSGALEATLFRPALQRAVKEASYWRACVVRESLAFLPPLPAVNNLREIDSGEKDEADELVELTLALADYRVEIASTSIVDLTRRDKSPRMQLRESLARKQGASQRLHAVVRRCQSRAFI